MQGKLVVRPLSAEFKKGSRYLARFDPFVKIFVGKEQLRTNVHKKGGKNPFWTDILSYINPTDNAALVEVWDKGKIRSDRMIGQCKFSIPNVVQKKIVTENIPLRLCGKIIGTISLEVQWEGYQTNTAPIYFPPSQSSNVIMAQPGYPYSQENINPQLYQQQYQPEYQQPGVIYAAPINTHPDYDQSNARPNFV